MKCGSVKWINFIGHLSLSKTGGGDSPAEARNMRFLPGFDSLGGSAFRHQRVNFLDELFLQLFHIVDGAGHEILH